MNGNHWNDIWKQTTHPWSLPSPFLTSEGCSPAIFRLELHSLKFLTSQAMGFALAPLGDCSWQEAFCTIQLWFSISHFSLQEKSFLSSMTARRRSLGLRTTPRPPVQRSVRAAGATMEEVDACIFEPKINLKIKNKIKKINLKLCLLINPYQAAILCLMAEKWRQQMWGLHPHFV